MSRQPRGRAEASRGEEEARDHVYPQSPILMETGMTALSLTFLRELVNFDYGLSR